MKIFPVEAKMFHAERQTDGQTEMTKTIVAFHDVTKASKNKSVEINDSPIFDRYGGYLFPATFTVFSLILCSEFVKTRCVGNLSLIWKQITLISEIQLKFTVGLKV